MALDSYRPIWKDITLCYFKKLQTVHNITILARRETLEFLYFPTLDRLIAYVTEKRATVMENHEMELCIP
jgi:hypothetical protein